MISGSFSPGYFLRKGINNNTWLPVLKVIASSDINAEVYYQKGKKIVRFPRRRRAAETIAKITGKPSFYLGLDGEKIFGNKDPEKPYDKQIPKIVTLLLDRLEKCMQIQPGSIELYRATIFSPVTKSIHSCNRHFGAVFKEHLVKEAKKRNLY